MQPPRHLLLIRLDGLGDTVLTTPLVRALRDAWPDLRITCIASPAGAAAVDPHPGIDLVKVIDPLQTTLYDKWHFGRRLRLLGCDTALVITEKAWGYIWAWMSGATTRIGFWAGQTQPLKAALFGPTLTHRVDNPNDPSVPSTQHEAERIMRIAEPYGLRPCPQRSWLPGPGWMPPAVPRIAVHLSLKWLTLGHGEAWLSELLRRLQALVPPAQDGHGGVVVSAGPAERSWAAHFMKRLSDITEIDTSTFTDWCMGLSSATLLVTPDTGAVHVAAALGVPVVDIFDRAGHAHCVPRWHPYQVPHRVVLRGRPQSDAEAAQAMTEIIEQTASLLAEVRRDP